MGAYCRRAYIRRHAARVGEIMEVRRFSSYYYDVALFGDQQEIACIPHKGCSLEIVATAETSDGEVNMLLPGQAIWYTRSFFFGDRLELPSGRKVGFETLVGFKLQLAPRMTVPPPVEETVVERAMRGVTMGETPEGMGENVTIRDGDYDSRSGREGLAGAPGSRA